jgi:hypothetical protein
MYLYILKFEICNVDLWWIHKKGESMYSENLSDVK